MHRTFLVPLLATLLLWLLPARPLTAAPMPTLDAEMVAGAQMRLPRGWQRTQDDYSLVLTENPRDPESAVAALFAVQGQPGQRIEVGQVADTILAGLDLEANQIRAQLIESRTRQGALYRLHRLDKRGRSGYLVSYTNADSRSGAVVHLLFSALDQRFVELGGPLFPLVVYGGLPPTALDELRRDTAPVAHVGTCAQADDYGRCVAGQHFGGSAAQPAARSLSDAVSDRCQQRLRAARTAADLASAKAACNEEVALASQISRMSHESMMKTIYNLDSGWCYRGEDGCD